MRVVSSSNSKDPKKDTPTHILTHFNANNLFDVFDHLSIKVWPLVEHEGVDFEDFNDSHTGLVTAIEGYQMIQQLHLKLSQLYTFLDTSKGLESGVCAKEWLIDNQSNSSLKDKDWR